MLTFRISAAFAATTAILALGMPAHACDERYPHTCRPANSAATAPNAFDLFAKLFGGRTKSAPTRKSKASAQRRDATAAWSPTARPTPPVKASKRGQALSVVRRPHIIQLAGQPVPVVSPHELNEVDLAADAVQVVAVDEINEIDLAAGPMQPRPTAK